MSKLKEIKILFKNENLWKKYKKKFQHRQMKLLFSKIVLVFNKNISATKLYAIEKNILNTQLNYDMFVQAYLQINQLNNDQYDWVSFGKFIFYVYQTSTYWKDQKLKINNIFNKNNFIEINCQKRLLYFKWMHSILIQEKNYNQKIISILKKVF